MQKIKKIFIKKSDSPIYNDILYLAGESASIMQKEII
jgi:hypothetical protein